MKETCFTLAVRTTLLALNQQKKSQDTISRTYINTLLHFYLGTELPMDVQVSARVVLEEHMLRPPVAEPQIGVIRQAQDRVIAFL
jgi:hypothetical protein